MSVGDLDETVEFYERAFGYARNGGVRRLFDGKMADKVLAHEGVRHQLRWMSDQDPRFQLEFVHFDEPAHRPMPASARVCDIGYRRMSLWVQRFDAVVERLSRDGNLLAEPRSYAGARRVCCRDPNGVVLELLEHDIPEPPGGARRFYALPVRTRAVTLSVPSLAAAIPFFRDVLGMPRANFELHSAEMEASWGLPGAVSESACFWAGGHLVELVEYHEPRGMPRRDDEHLGDAGIYHIALHFARRRDVWDAYRRVTAAGYGSNSAPGDLRVTTIVYLRTGERAIVECFYFHPCIGRFIGFREQPWQ